MTGFSKGRFVCYTSPAEIGSKVNEFFYFTFDFVMLIRWENDI